MILHLGNDCFVRMKSILMILDYEEAVKNQDTGLFLEGFHKISVSEAEQPKAIVVTNEDGENKMYLSPISSRTLLKRSGKKAMLASLSIEDR